MLNKAKLFAFNDFGTGGAPRLNNEATSQQQLVGQPREQQVLGTFAEGLVVAATDQFQVFEVDCTKARY